MQANMEKHNYTPPVEPPTRLERKEQFLYDLEELYKKHSIVVDGCGCCESPYLLDFTHDKDSAEQIKNNIAHLREVS